MQYLRMCKPMWNLGQHTVELFGLVSGTHVLVKKSGARLRPLKEGGGGGWESGKGGSDDRGFRKGQSRDY